jgi:hypothetical protein
MLSNYGIIALTIIALTGSLLTVSGIHLFPPVYGHGLSGDMAMPASIGDRLATVRVDMRPAFLLAEAPQDATIEMRFFDTKTDKTIQHVTFFITLNKGERVLMQDWFHAHDGDLFIKVRPTEQPNVVINAPKEPILDGWIGSKDSPALAQGPIFLEGGLYHFQIEIFSIDFDQTILEPPIKYDAYISIGETTTYAVSNGQEQQVSIRTYYDKTQEFSFDEKNKIVKFSMPFTWDKEYLSQVPLLHQEVVIPKSFTELATGKYTGMLNGIRLPEIAVMVDDSDPNDIIVHYMIPNQPLLQLAQQVAMTDGEVNKAEFILAPGTVDIGIPLDNKTNSQTMNGKMMATSNRGSFHATLSWTPTVIEPDRATSFTFDFMDVRTSTLLRDTTYNLLLLKDGQEILKRERKTVGGVGSEQFTFTGSHMGSVTLRLENINNTGESIDFNMQVVPEFPLSTIFVMMAAVSAIAIAMTKKINFTVRV